MVRVPVVFASDLADCDCCGEPWCDKHEDHYADCPCIGPSDAEDRGYDLVEIDGVLYAEKRKR